MPVCQHSQGRHSEHLRGAPGLEGRGRKEGRRNSCCGKDAPSKTAPSPSTHTTRQQMAFQRTDLCPGFQTSTKAANIPLSTWMSCDSICSGLDLALPALEPLSKPPLGAERGPLAHGSTPTPPERTATISSGSLRPPYLLLYLWPECCVPNHRHSAKHEKPPPGYTQHKLRDCRGRWSPSRGKNP